MHALTTFLTFWIVQKLRRELAVWRRLKHENVQPLYGVCFDLAPYPAMVSRWHSNGDINAYIRSQTSGSADSFHTSIAFKKVCYSVRSFLILRPCASSSQEY